jgi:magnesium-transporting ATPase (P-type)
MRATHTLGRETAGTGDVPQPMWHALDLEACYGELRSGPQGPSCEEAARRLESVGPNVLARASADGPLIILWRQINSPLIWVLMASALLAVTVGKLTDGLVVLAVVMLNAVVGFLQEYRATRAIDALRAMVPQDVTALRDAHPMSVAAPSLVPGDIVLLSSGDKVPADLRLLAQKNLRIDEAALTGESLPAEKRLAPVAEDAPVGDRGSMAFAGTLVTYGTAAGIVVATAGDTELGRISALLQQAVPLETPLTRALATIGKYITFGIVAMSALLLAIGLARAMGAGVALGDAARDTLVFAIALAVGAIPEGLPAIVTIALAIGVQRMARRRAIIRKLPAVETLGATTVICTDKTGTLTRNEMTVVGLWTPAGGVCQVEGVGYTPLGGFRALGQAAFGAAPPRKRGHSLRRLCCAAMPPLCTPTAAGPSLGTPRRRPWW